MTFAIRLATSHDAPQIAAIYQPIARDTHISFEREAPDAAEIARRIESALLQYPWLVCAERDRVAAYAYASAFRARAAYQWTAETTVYTHPAFQRRGIARAIYTSLLTILRAQGYVNAIGVVALPNAASVRAHESLGFRQIGIIRKAGFKAGAWRDTAWLQLDLRVATGDPQPPLPIVDLAQRHDFADMLRSGLTCIRSATDGETR